jgi:hypothetical protein
LAWRLKTLAATVGTIDGKLRQRIGLDAPADVHVLEHVPPPVDDDGRRAKPARARR